MPHPQRRVHFPEQPDAMDLGFRWKKLHSPYMCTWDQDGVKVRLTVPAGFVYNGASVPQVLWSVFPPHALDRAAVFHDFIYRAAGVLPFGSHQYLREMLTPGVSRWETMTPVWTRSQADSLFLDQLAQDPDGPGWVRRKVAFATVGALGGGKWGPSSIYDFEQMRERERG